MWSSDSAVYRLCCSHLAGEQLGPELYGCHARALRRCSVACRGPSPGFYTQTQHPCPPAHQHLPSAWHNHRAKQPTAQSEHSTLRGTCDPSALWVRRGSLLLPGLPPPFPQQKLSRCFLKTSSFPNHRFSSQPHSPSCSATPPQHALRPLGIPIPDCILMARRQLAGCKATSPSITEETENGGRSGQASLGTHTPYLTLDPLTSPSFLNPASRRTLQSHWPPHACSAF